MKPVEDIIAEMRHSYESRTQMRLSPADMEMILIYCMAYRELKLRAEIENYSRQNFVQTATGEALDQWGELFGAARSDGESDDDFRKRVLAATKNSQGTLADYRERVLAVSGITDVTIRRRFDDGSIPPGTIRLYILPYNAALMSQVVDTLQDPSFGVLGLEIDPRPSVAVPLNGTAEVRGKYNLPESSIQQDVKEKVSAYFAELSKYFSSTFSTAALQEEINKCDTITSISDINFPSVPRLNPGEYYTMGNVNIRVL